VWNYSVVKRPDADVLEAWTALLVAHRRITSELDGELRRRAGTTLDEYDVLFQLRAAGGGARMSELAGEVLISRPSTTRVVDGLVARGWLRRRQVARDRRLVLVELTAAGRAAQARAGRVHLDGIERRVGRPLAGHDVSATAAALRALAAGG
jgi:DNA-binding MarR family transcriptional regulator